MGGEHFSEAAAEALLNCSPTASATDVPATKVDALIRAVRGDVTADELVGFDDVLRTFEEASQVRTVMHWPDARGGPRLSRLGRRAVALGVIGSVVVVGAAAAATGRLPAPVQRFVADGASSVGIHLPSPSSSGHGDEKDSGAGASSTPRTDGSGVDSTRPSGGLAGTVSAAGAVRTSTDESDASSGSSTTPARGSTTSRPGDGPVTGTQPSATDALGTVAPADDSATTAVARGPSLDGPAKTGLCRAYVAAGSPANPKSVAFKDLLSAAAAAHVTVAEFCLDVLTTATSSGATAVTIVPETSTAAAPPSNGNGVGAGNGVGNSNGNDDGSDDGGDGRRHTRAALGGGR